MRVHHLQCGSFCPRLGSDAVTHCLLVETPASGLLLVDTGFGDATSRDPMRLPWVLRFQLRPRLAPADSALAQVRALGFAPEDVRHVVVTHLDSDHAGGLADFPGATVHVHAPELEATRTHNARYDAALWAHEPRWQTYAPEGDRWLGFACVRPLEELADEVALVPLIGHTRGHAGVAVRTKAGWLLHAGDAYLIPEEIRGGHVPWGTRLAARFTTELPAQRRENVARLQELVARRGSEVDVISSHATGDFERLRVRPPRRSSEASAQPSRDSLE